MLYYKRVITNSNIFIAKICHTFTNIFYIFTRICHYDITLRCFYCFIKYILGNKPISSI